MKPAAVRFALVSLLFLAWLGYMGFLVATRPRTAAGPLVVSRPQVLTSEADAVVRIDNPEGEAVVVKVLWEKVEGSLKESQRIKIDNIADCRPPGRDSTPDWSGPGEYLAPLRPRRGGGWEVAAIPDSPGFGGRVVRIYPDTNETRAQYESVRKPE